MPVMDPPGKIAARVLQNLRRAEPYMRHGCIARKAQRFEEVRITELPDGSQNRIEFAIFADDSFLVVEETLSPGVSPRKVVEFLIWLPEGKLDARTLAMKGHQE